MIFYLVSKTIVRSAYVDALFKKCLNVLCGELNITHKTIRTVTPWHNGKVERSHKSD